MTFSNNIFIHKNYIFVDIFLQTYHTLITLRSQQVRILSQILKKYHMSILQQKCYLLSHSKNKYLLWINLMVINTVFYCTFRVLYKWPSIHGTYQTPVIPHCRIEFSSMWIVINIHIIYIVLWCKAVISIVIIQKNIFNNIMFFYHYLLFF